MPLPIDVVQRDMAPSPMVDVVTRRWATRLHRSFDRIEACQVIVTQVDDAERGQGFHVRIRLSVPGDSVVVIREPPADHDPEDVYAAIREAFRTARRQLAAHRSRYRNPRPS